MQLEHVYLPNLRLPTRTTIYLIHKNIWALQNKIGGSEIQQPSGRATHQKEKLVLRQYHPKQINRWLGQGRCDKSLIALYVL